MNDFIPTFTRVADLDEAAHYINRPHDDYPMLVEDTKYLIMDAIISRRFTKFHLWQIHSVIGRKLLYDTTLVGQWRRIIVTVGGRDTCPPHLIDDRMSEILPIKLNPADWYREFQLIHPFADGNGRVGGIVYTALMFIGTDDGEWHAPCQ